MIPILSLLSVSALASSGRDHALSTEALRRRVCVMSVLAGGELLPEDTEVIENLWLNAVRTRCVETGVDPERVLNEVRTYRFAWAANGVTSQFIKYSLGREGVPTVTLQFTPSSHDLNVRLSLVRQALQLGPLEVPPATSPEEFLNDLRGRRVLIEVLVREADRKALGDRVPLALEPLLENGNVYLLLRDITSPH